MASASAVTRRVRDRALASLSALAIPPSELFALTPQRTPREPSPAPDRSTIDGRLNGIKLSEDVNSVCTPNEGSCGCEPSAAPTPMPQQCDHHQSQAMGPTPFQQTSTQRLLDLLHQALD